MYSEPTVAWHHGLVHRRGSIWLSCGLAVALAGAGAGGYALSSGGAPHEGGKGRAVAAVAPMPVVVVAKPAPKPSGPRPTLIATLAAPTAYSSVPGGAQVAVLPATNPFGTAEVLAVLGQADAGWLHVELPVRPNGSAGWIRAAGVTLSETSYHVLVNREADSVTVTDAGRVVVSTPAAVGKPSTPTPSGPTYLWELVRPDDPDGAYGPYIFGLAMFSDAYSVFNGGDAQIGLHGQDEPSSVGHPVSHGCVRVGNNVISELAAMLPLGTPVTIV